MTTAATAKARSFKGTHTEGRTPEELRELVSHVGAELELAPAEDIVEWAVATFGKRFCITSSMGDAVLAHVAVAGRARRRRGVPRHRLPLPGDDRHRRRGRRDDARQPDPDHAASRRVAEQDAEYGPELYKRDPDLCCQLRKVDPLQETLQGYDAWATGLRRAETHNRVIAPVVGWDARKGKVKVSPLARWTDEDVDRYIAEHGVLVNPLALRRLPLHRLRPVHPPGRSRRGPAQRALGRHHQDRVRDPLMTALPDPAPDRQRRRSPDTEGEQREEAALMAAPALVALAHGSRDPRSAATIKALVNEVRALRPDLRIETAFLDLAKPTLNTVVDKLARARFEEVVVVPLLLTDATTPTSTSPPPWPRPMRGTRASRSGRRRSWDSRPASSRCSTSGCARR